MIQWPHITRCSDKPDQVLSDRPATLRFSADLLMSHHFWYKSEAIHCFIDISFKRISLDVMRLNWGVTMHALWLASGLPLCFLKHSRPQCAAVETAIVLHIFSYSSLFALPLSDFWKGTGCSLTDRLHFDSALSLSPMAKAANFDELFNFMDLVGNGNSTCPVTESHFLIGRHDDIWLNPLKRPVQTGCSSF